MHLIEPGRSFYNVFIPSSVASPFFQRLRRRWQERVWSCGYEYRSRVRHITKSDLFRYDLGKHTESHQLPMSSVSSPYREHRHILTQWPLSGLNHRDDTILNCHRSPQVWILCITESSGRLFGHSISTPTHVPDHSSSYRHLSSSPWQELTDCPFCHFPTPLLLFSNPLSTWYSDHC